MRPVIEERRGERGRVDALTLQKIDEHLAVERIEQDEAASPVADGGHCGHVARTPAIGERVAIQIVTPDRREKI